MEIKVCIFSIDSYEREKLEKLSDEEKYDLAHVASNFGYDEADVLTLTEFEKKINNDRISLDSSWVYFVNI